MRTKRVPRQKPMREPEHEELRVAVCKRCLRKPKKIFPNKVDMFMDTKYWPLATSRLDSTRLVVSCLVAVAGDVGVGVRVGYGKQM